MKSRYRYYQVRAEGPEGSFYGGIIPANTKRAAIRRAVVKFRLENLTYSLSRRAHDYHWSAEFVRISPP